MKNFLFISIILVFCLILTGFDLRDNNICKITDVERADIFFVDFNKNSVTEPNEIVQLCDCESFDTKISNLTLKQAKKCKISSEEAVSLGYLGQKFSEKQLLNKTVKINIIDKTSRPMKVTICTNGEDFGKILAKQGYTVKSNISENLKIAKTLNLVWLNKKSLKYHALSCKYARKSCNLGLVPLETAQKVAHPCNYCLNKIPRVQTFKIAPYIPPNEPNRPYFTDGVVSLYVTNPNLFLDAPDTTRTSISKALLECVNKAQASIEFATFGIEGQKEIINALLNAENQDVKVKWVTDLEPNGKNIYKNTLETMQILKNVMTDFGEDASALMHNKFFIFDGKTVFAGSANLSNTDLSGFNANVFLKINSEPVATVFEQEFEQMYSGLFHKKKNKILNKTNIHLANDNVVSVYFSPKDCIISTIIVPLINDAREYVYMPIFFLTDESVAQSLIDAKYRGVEVRVIIDAVAASNNYSKHKKLRAAKIPVKTEDWAGKMHQKSLIIDDETVVIGSMNFSKSGDAQNDENCVVIKNAPALAKKYKQYFLMLYNSIPNKWLVKDPAPESPDSVGSCFDKVDNDYDGKIDADDEGCFRVRKYKKHY